MADTSGKLSDLSQPRRFITSHNDEGKAIVHTAEEAVWKPYHGSQMAFSVMYSTSEQPPDLNDNIDISKHDQLMQKPDGVGLVNPNGTVLRYVDFAPGYRCGMHRTQSLDYGIVMEGNIDMVLDSGEVHHMKKGDIAVQRATQHQWVNTSSTKWARMLFCLQDCKPLTVSGKEMREELGDAGLPPSGN